MCGCAFPVFCQHEVKCGIKINYHKLSPSSDDDLRNNNLLERKCSLGRSHIAQWFMLWSRKFPGSNPDYRLRDSSYDYVILYMTTRRRHRQTIQTKKRSFTPTTNLRIFGTILCCERSCALLPLRACSSTKNDVSTCSMGSLLICSSCICPDVVDSFERSRSRDSAVPIFRHNREGCGEEQGKKKVHRGWMHFVLD